MPDVRTLTVSLLLALAFATAPGVASAAAPACTITDPTPGGHIVHGTSSNDVICAGTGNDVVYGGGGNDRIYGGEGGDTIFADAGDDVIFGEAGNDRMLGARGNDTFNGGADFDTADYSLQSGKVTVTVGAGAGNDGLATEDDTVRADVESVIGGAGNDDLTGDDSNEALIGGKGADTLRGAGGYDRLVGGPGADALKGGLNSDVVDYSASGSAVTATIGGAGAGGDAEGDTIDGDVEYMLGSASGDELIGDGDANLIYGNGGDDELHGAGGDDQLLGGPGADVLDGGAGTNDAVTYADRITGAVQVTVGDAGQGDGNPNEGDDVQATVERLIGTRFGDQLVAGPLGTRIDGLDGNDTITGGASLDILNGGAGDDTVISRDAVFDQVNCGDGIDAFDADALDASVLNCETAMAFAVPDTTTTDEDTATAAVDVLVNDVGAGLTLGALSNQVGTGTFTPGAGGITYTPAGYDHLPAGGSEVASIGYDVTGTAGGSGSTLSVTVNGLNDAPTVTAPSAPGTYAENGSPTAIDAGATVGEVDDLDQIESATVKITDATRGTGDTLALGTPSAKVDESFSDGTLTLTPKAGETPVLADWVAALRAVTFETSENAPSASRAFDFAVSDGTDQGQASQTMTVTPTNDAPTDIALDPSSVAENEAAGTTVGTLSSTDPDDTSGFTYELAAGGTDNGDFEITGATVKTKKSFDYEAKQEYSIRVKSTDTGGASFEEDVTVSVTDADDPPAFTSSATPSAAENTLAAQTVQAADPEGGSVTYSLTGGADQALFTIDGTTGALEFLTAPDFESPADAGANNVYDVQVTATDGTTPVAQNLAVTVTNVNEAPTFTSGSAPSAPENQTAVQTVTSTDPEGDAITYSLSDGDDKARFSIDPGTGALTFASAPNFEAPADADADNEYVVEVNASDGTNDAKQTIRVTVTDVNDAPTIVNDSYTEAVGNTTAVLGDTVSEPNVTLSGMSGNVPLENDSDEDGDTISVIAETVSTTGGGSATIDADGTFTYKPGAGDKNQTDSFTYRVTDGEATSNGTVQVGIEDTLVWYVNGSQASDVTGDGRSASPYRTLSGINGAGGAGDADGTGDYLFLYGSNTYSGGLPLETNQKLIGSPHGLSVPDHPNLVTAAGTNAVVTNSGGDAIALAAGAEVQRVNAAGASGVGIRGTSVTTATVGPNTVVTNNSGGGIVLSGAAGGDISIGSSIENQNGSVASVANRSSGTVTLSGDMTSANGGVSATSNTGATVAFTGKLDLTRTSGQAFTATGGGNVKATGSGSKLSTTSATALQVSSTTIASGGLNFEKVSASGATNGISLQNTGSTAGLTVSGTGSAGSGGTINGSTAAGILLSSVSNVALASMNITNGGDDGVRGTNVSGFSLTGGSQVTANGQSSDENGLDFADLTGTVSLTNATVSGSGFRNVEIYNASGVLDATISGGAYSNTMNSVIGDAGIYVEGTDTGTINLTVENATLANNRGDHIRVGADSVNTVTENITIKGNTLSNVTGTAGGHLVLNPGGNMTMKASVLNNSISGANLHSIGVLPLGSVISPQPADVDVTISGNTVGRSNDNESGGGNGIYVRSTGAATVDALITNNSITQHVISGMELDQLNGNGSLNATVRGNTITKPATLADADSLQFGIFTLIGSGSDAGTSCLDIGGASALANDLTGSSANGSPDIRFAMNGAATTQLAGYTGGSNTSLAVNTYLAGRNTTPNGVSSTRSLNSKYAQAASCPLP